jgi:hypothetical protein
VTEKVYFIAEAREQVAQLLKSRVEQFSAEMLQLRQRELAKSQNTDPCLICGCEANACVCMTTLAKSAPVEKCGESMPIVGAPMVKKGELCADCGSKDCKCAGVLPGDKKSKDVTPKKDGAGGSILPDKKLSKGDVPMAKPTGGAPSQTAPTAKVGAPKLPGAKPKAAVAAPAAPMAPVAKSEEDLIEEFLAKATPHVAPVKGSAMPDTWNPTEHETPATAVPKRQFGTQDLAAAKVKLATPAVPAKDFTAAAAGAPAPAGSAAAGGIKPTASPAAPGVKPPMAAAPSPAKNRMAALSAALRGQKPA